MSDAIRLCNQVYINQTSIITSTTFDGNSHQVFKGNLRPKCEPSIRPPDNQGLPSTGLNGNQTTNITKGRDFNTQNEIY